jgi:enoyl-CoA hydratase
MDQVENLNVFTKDRVGYVQFDRPETLNALSPTMLDGLMTALEEFENDPQIRVLVICAAGRAFSTGGDLSGPGRQAKPANEKSAFTDWQRTRDSLARWLRIWESPMPVVAAVQGYCMGIATMLAEFCDLTVVAEDAIIGWPQLPVGGGQLAPVASWFIGAKKARELSYTAGSRFSGTDAVALGWANLAVPADELMERTHAFASSIARTPSDVLALKKFAINRTLEVQGFRTAVQAGAEFGAISHFAPGAEALGRIRVDQGLKETIAAFRNGEIDLEY